MPLLALGELGSDELGRGALHHLGVEAFDQLVIERPVAGEIARLQNGGADGHVAARLPDRFIDRAGGMADLQAHVPQRVEDGFGDLLAPGGLLVGQDEQEIDVRLRRHQAAAIAAGRDHGHPLGAARHLRPVQMLGGRRVKDADDLVLHEAQPLGATPAVAVLQELRLGHGAGLDQLGLQQLHHGGAEHVLPAGMLRGERIDGRREAGAVKFGEAFGSGIRSDAVHGCNRISNKASAVTKLPMRQSIHAAVGRMEMRIVLGEAIERKNNSREPLA